MNIYRDNKEKRQIAIEKWWESKSFKEKSKLRDDYQKVYAYNQKRKNPWPNVKNVFGLISSFNKSDISRIWRYHDTNINIK